ncbi:uncharacterized protein BCR38DRAFT_14733 [Pseudomassariella vexata]|uniref:Uncharacterized protein n=1 Tax=Pseudomassariella vexata TaxID=1141098 RepID=A0A1Y2EJ90_9PEZI|nr:uncharacterized protein BCR38DRAFT_14733 [Pseudomassariella vexata]ORY71621.1 hypothetical protein BCR38DRAFT_14733 [Pseudomassariella vexata]
MYTTVGLPRQRPLHHDNQASGRLRLISAGLVTNKFVITLYSYFDHRRSYVDLSDVSTNAQPSLPMPRNPQVEPSSSMMQTNNYHQDQPYPIPYIGLASLAQNRFPPVPPLQLAGGVTCTYSKMEKVDLSKIPLRSINVCRICETPGQGTYIAQAKDAYGQEPSLIPPWGGKTKFYCESFRTSGASACTNLRFESRALPHRQDPGVA